MPCDRADLAIAAMRRGKDVMVDKPGITTPRPTRRGRAGGGGDRAHLVDLLRPARIALRCSEALRIVRSGEIGRRGAHRRARAAPAEPRRCGRRGSSTRRPMAASSTTSACHPIDQFLAFAGVADAEIVSSSVGASAPSRRLRGFRARSCWRRRCGARLHAARLVHAGRAADLGRRPAPRRRHRGTLELRKIPRHRGARRHRPPVRRQQGPHALHRLQQAAGDLLSATSLRDIARPHRDGDAATAVFTVCRLALQAQAQARRVPAMSRDRHCRHRAGQALRAAREQPGRSRRPRPRGVVPPRAERGAAERRLPGRHGFPTTTDIARRHRRSGGRCGDGADAGRPRICESPSARSPPASTCCGEAAGGRSSARGEQLIAAGRRAGRRLGICPAARFRPAQACVARAAANRPARRDPGGDDDGAVVAAAILLRRAGRGMMARDGGGVLMTQAIHTLDLFRWLVGVAVEAAQVRTTALHRMETEDYASGAGGLGNGAPGTIMATTGALSGQPRTDPIIGTRARRCWTAALRVVAARWRREEVPMTAVPAAAPTSWTSPHDAHRALLADFLDAIEQDAIRACPARRRWRPRRLIDDILAKARRMKITDIKTFLMQAGSPPNSGAWARELRDHLRPAARNWLFVKVYTDEGITGIGEGSGWPRVIQTAIEDFKGVLIGEDPGRYRAALAEDADRDDGPRHDRRGRRRRHDRHRDGALGHPGEVRQQADLQPARRARPRPRADLRARRHARAGPGARRARLRRAQVLAAERARCSSSRICARRSATSIDLMTDVHGPPWYSVADAIRVGQELEEYDILFYRGSGRRPRTSMRWRRSRRRDQRAAGGRRAVHVASGAAREIIEREIVDVVQPDMGRAGGFLQMKKIAAMAEAHHICRGAAFDGSLGPVAEAAALHLLASIPNALILEHLEVDWPGRDEVITAASRAGRWLSRGARRAGPRRRYRRGRRSPAIPAR